MGLRDITFLADLGIFLTVVVNKNASGGASHDYDGPDASDGVR